MNPLYQQLMGGGAPQQMSPRQQALPMNPFQRANAVYQAMRNPAAFVRQMIPDLPQEISNDPNQILQYMQQNMGVTNEQIQQAAYSIPRF